MDAADVGNVAHNANKAFPVGSTIRFCLARTPFITGLSFVFQQLLVADDFHGQAGANQRGEYRFGRTDHDALLLPAVGVIPVGTGQQCLYRRALGGQIHVHFPDGNRGHIQRIADEEHPFQADAIPFSRIEKTYHSGFVRPSGFCWMPDAHSSR